MVRTRFSSPVIGRRWLIGSDGRSLGAMDDGESGTVLIRDAEWPAVARQPVAADQAVQVIGIDKYTVVVQPEAF